MAHRRRPLVTALALNTAALVVEIGAGVPAKSLSLVMDGVHNLSDEAALAALVVAYSLRSGLSGRWLRAANAFNSLGLLAITTVLVWQALERYGGPVIASHNNCRALAPHQRQFGDDQIRAIVARDGVIGAALDAWMIRPAWVIGSRYIATNPPVTLSDVVDHIDHICQLAGNSRHVAIGTDLDGGFGREQSPADLDTIADLQKLPGLLAPARWLIRIPPVFPGLSRN
jgi:hypothetical protein